MSKEELDPHGLVIAAQATLNLHQENCFYATEGQESRCTTCVRLSQACILAANNETLIESYIGEPIGDI